jgi:tRNA A37 methylthiotransferase MiaB
VPIPVRKERNRVLRELAARKNLAFRQSMVGRTLSAVTLHEPLSALSANYLKVELAREQPANRIVDVRISATSAQGVRESPPGFVE